MIAQLEYIWAKWCHMSKIFDPYINIPTRFAWFVHINHPWGKEVTSALPLSLVITPLTTTKGHTRIWKYEVLHYISTIYCYVSTSHKIWLWFVLFYISNSWCKMKQSLNCMHNSAEVINKSIRLLNNVNKASVEYLHEHHMSQTQCLWVNHIKRTCVLFIIMRLIINGTILDIWWNMMIYF